MKTLLNILLLSVLSVFSLYACSNMSAKFAKVDSFQKSGMIEAWTGSIEIVYKDASKAPQYQGLMVSITTDGKSATINGLTGPLELGILPNVSGSGLTGDVIDGNTIEMKNVAGSSEQAKKRNIKARGRLIKSGKELYTDADAPIIISVDTLENEQDPDSKVKGHEDLIQITFIGSLISIF